MKTIEKTGVTIDAAVDAALKELGCGKDDVSIEVLNAGKRGLFGIFGSNEAKVRVTLINEPETDFDDDDDFDLTADDIETLETGGASERYETEGTAEIAPAALKKVETYLKDVLSMMGVPAAVSSEIKEGALCMDISGDMMGVVIGRHGDTLDSLQYLCSLVLNKETDDYVRVNLDTEDYREKREETLVNLAKKKAENVLRTGRRHVFEPMNPNERRIIHSTLQAYENLNTYSIGEDPNRKIVIESKSAPRRSRGGYRKNYSSSYRREGSRYERAPQVADSKSED
ncbi:MAG: protein jag [Clostridia bacterium]|nr:protein jag [Clostridia bacterium]